MFSGYYAGDVNQDNAIDIIDIVSLVYHIIEIDFFSDLEFQLADCDGNNIIDIADIIIIQNYIFDNNN